MKKVDLGKLRICLDQADLVDFIVMNHDMSHDDVCDFVGVYFDYEEKVICSFNSDDRELPKDDVGYWISEFFIAHREEVPNQECWFIFTD